jgi:NADP-dependent 3-hydroxy acid dehydrogenase YdfG
MDRGKGGYRMEDKRLKGKVAVVTGSRRGIGRAVALAPCGIRVNTPARKE